MDNVGLMAAIAKAMAIAPTNEQVTTAVSDWLDDHPEATTTVLDGAISYAKLDSSLKGTVDDVGDLNTEIQTKANVDGSYSSLTAGNAEQLVSTVGVEDKTPYLLRTTGGSADVWDRVKLSEITGGTVAWNQQYGSSETINLSVPDSHASQVVLFTSGARVVSGHKYLFSAKFSYVTNVANTIFAQMYTKVDGSNKVIGEVRSKLNGVASSIFQSAYSAVSNGSASVEGGFWAYCAMSEPDTNGSCSISNGQLFDLTAMLGPTIADYIYGLEQNTEGAGVAWFRKLFPKDYYAYDAGTLLSVKTTAHKEVGFNQWDEEWEVGSYDNTTGEKTAVPNIIRSKNYIPVVPDTVYYSYSPLDCFFTRLFYDASKNYIGYVASQNGTFTTPANACFMRFRMESSYGTTYNHDICINLSWDGERDGEYEPYEANTYALDDVELRGIPKLDASNNLYYDGDSYAPDGTVTRKYATRAYEEGDATDGSTMITDGTNTVYKLDTPTTESADPYTETQICNDFGVEEFVDSRTVPMPVGANALYQANLRAKLEMAPDSPDGDGDYLVRQTDGLNEYVAVSDNSTISGLSTRCPACPTDTDGTFVLKATVSSGAVTYAWTAES